MLYRTLAFRPVSHAASCLSPAEIVKGVKPGSVDGIVAIGGDGTMHEVLQVWTCAAVLLANRCRSDGGGQHQHALLACSL